MFTLPTLLNCLKGLIGFEHSYSAEIPDIDQDLTKSSSGIYIGSGMHPLLTYENIMAVAQQFALVTVKNYSGTITYHKGAVVKSGADIYYALQETTNQTPASSPAAWAKTTLLSAYLRRMYEGACNKMLQSLFTHKKINEASKTLLANMVLYEGQGNIQKRIEKTGRFVGLKLILRHPDTVALLSKIGLQLDTIQNNVQIYLFHSSSNEPITTWTIDHTKSVTFQWHRVTEQTLSFLDDQVNAGGSYYIGYYENQLTGQAIAKDIKWSSGGGCSSCSESVTNKRYFAMWGKFIVAQPFYVNSPVVGQMWDEDKEFYVDETNFGINVQLAVQCDLSRVLCSHSRTMADLLSKQITVDLLQEMAYSMRDNQVKQKLGQLAAVALDNQENGQWGEMKKLTKAVEAFDFDLSDISPVCNPCSDGKFGVKKMSVWQ